MYYAIDSYQLSNDEKVIEFFRQNEKGHHDLVYACRTQEGNWAVLNRSVANLITKEELIRHSSKDGDETNRILKEIDPDMFDAAERMLKENGVSLDSVSKPTPGQYL